MAYTKKQREMRCCKKIKANGEQCRGFSKLNSEFCSLHSYNHRRELPKTEAERKAAAYRRASRRAEPQRRAVCNCSMLPYPHRFSSSGACPDSPVVRKVGDAEEMEQARARGKVSNKQSEDAGENKYLRDLGAGIRDEPPALTEYRRKVEEQTSEEQTDYERMMSRIWSGSV